MNDSYIDDRKLHEECGVFGAYDFDCGDISSTIYYGLFELQQVLRERFFPTRIWDL